MRYSATLMLFLFAALSLLGCNMPLTPIEPVVRPTSSPRPPQPTRTKIQPTPTITPTPAAVHKDMPGSPVGKQFQTVHDQVDTNTASQKQAFGGDDFRNGKYERPFDQQMNYLPEADLVTIQLNREDPLWVYVLIKVIKPFSAGRTGRINYMVEIDTDLDNRGDVLIITGIPKSTDWSSESVQVFTAPDRNVGGEIAVRPDPVLSEGKGYYEEKFNDGIGADPDLAWSRLSKTSENTVEIAFKNTLTGGEKGKFIWLPWADAGMLNWSLFDYNDHFTFKMAGYPIKEDAENYPLKDLWGVDNTCRVASGFEPTGSMPGLCPQSNPPEPEVPPEECHWVCHSGLTLICGCE